MIKSYNFWIYHLNNSLGVTILFNNINFFEISRNFKFVSILNNRSIKFLYLTYYSFFIFKIL